MECSWSGLYGQYLDVEIFPLGRKNIWKEQGEVLMAGLWDPVRLKNVKATRGISGLAMHSSE